MTKTRCSVSQAASLEQQTHYRGIVMRLAAHHPALRVFDSFSRMCDGTDCAAGNREMLFYSDSHHLSVRGSQRMAEHFIPWLNGSSSRHEQR